VMGRLGLLISARGRSRFVMGRQRLGPFLKIENGNDRAWLLRTVTVTV
jgi:hypothetical protein